MTANLKLRWRPGSVCVRCCQYAISMTSASWRINPACGEGEEVHAYRGPRVIAPEEVVGLS